jgi:hypothetical protein
MFAGAVAGAYGGFAPVRRAWDGLRRELEAAADDEAAKVVGNSVVLSALVKVALMGHGASRAAEAGFSNAEHLRWRIARLEHPGTIATWSTALAGASAALTGSAMALVACLLAGAPETLVGILACSAFVAAAGFRPMWGWKVNWTRLQRGLLTTARDVQF